MSEMKTTVDGRDWYPFTVTYDTPDGEFSFQIHALSWYHAQLMLESIKENAKIEGQIIEEIPE